MGNISIEYGDIALTAKDDLTASASSKQSFSKLALLKQNNVAYKKYATFEQNFCVLDGSFKNFPDDPSLENFALWSALMSNSSGNFSTPITLTCDFASYITSVGLTIYFSTATNDYAKNVNVKWYRDSTLLSDEDYTVNNAVYFCENTVERFNKVVITFQKTNNPYRYLKIEDIIWGTGRTFDENVLREVNLLEDVSLTSEEIRINTLDFTLSNKQDVAFTFQKTQPLKFTRNNELLGVFFIDSAVRKSKTIWELKTVDYIGVLDKIPFDGGTYSNVTVSTLISTILGNRIPYNLNSSLANITLSGTLEKCSKREALLQVAFAICAIVDCSRSESINIYPASSTVVSNIEEGIYDGQTFETEDEVTEIRIKLNNDTVVSKRNPYLPSDVYDNVLEFEGVFINSSNANTVLNFLYDYYVTNKNKTAKMRIPVNNGEKVGDVITYYSEEEENKKGRISQMEFGFNSNKLVAKAEVKELEV